MKDQLEHNRREELNTDLFPTGTDQYKDTRNSGGVYNTIRFKHVIHKWYIIYTIITKNQIAPGRYDAMPNDMGVLSSRQDDKCTLGPMTII